MAQAGASPRQLLLRLVQLTRAREPRSRLLSRIGSEHPGLVGLWVRALFMLARPYRRTMLRSVTFVGVTGSSGKTMAKELIVAILSTRLTGHKTPHDLNQPRFTAMTILRTRPWHDFCVLEIAGNRRPLDRVLAVAKPRIGVLTTIGAEHDTVEAMAAEKGKLVAMLPGDGTAVLNADDPRVLAMQAQCPGRVLTYGVAPSAMVRAEAIDGRWPDRLAFTVVHAGRSLRVHTQLCGTHWVSSVLAALTTALAMGIPLAAAVEAVRTVPPFPGRMSPVPSPDGVTFIRDDAKAPLWSIALAFRFLQEARARRKIIVIGTISDYTGDPGRKYAAVARQALVTGDHVVFVGQNAAKVLKLKQHLPDGALHALPSVDAAQRHLERILAPGDLVLLKGSRADHLETLVHARVASPDARAPAGPGPAPAPVGPPVRAIVGLGNPGERYERTPHNVGQRALDVLARSLGVMFAPDDEAMVARVDHPAGTCYLVKPLTAVNAAGPVLRRLAQRLGFAAETCILLHDDIDLPVGAVRVRMDGGDGGHRGVRSVLEAFESFAVRRVKIGVGRPAQGDHVARHVLDAFDPVELAAIDKACAEAAARALGLGAPPPQ